MPDHPTPTRTDHERFCERDMWARVRDARGRNGTHHVTFELVLHDGRILRTRVSRPVNRTTYGIAMWKHILRDQLEVSEPEFWSCVRDGRRPARGVVETPEHALPLALVYQLKNALGLPESEIRTMSKDEAIRRLNDHWSAR